MLTVGKLILIACFLVHTATTIVAMNRSHKREIRSQRVKSTVSAPIESDTAAG